jgi:gentisate 1,2-dioxygenase
MAAMPSPASTAARRQTIADLPVQHARDPKSPAEARARFFNPGNAFDIKLPAVPDHIFTAEPLQALDADSPTGLIPCDLSGVLACSFPATAPLMLARYAKIRATESLETAFVASGIICYVIQGKGSSSGRSGAVHWDAGDVFILPGGALFTHAAQSDAVLWIVTNEPQLAFEALRAPADGQAPTDLVHYTKDEIARQLKLLQDTGRDEATAGIAVLFSSDRQEANRNIMPTLTLAMNALPPGQSQRAHRHNAAAIMLLMEGEGCYSLMDGKRKDWVKWATTVTPPQSIHSHYNDGGRQAMFLVVQDGGLFYHLRTMGFSFAEQPQ